MPIWLLALILAITCVLGVQMGHASPFWTSIFQELSNDIKNILIQWVLALKISFWTFENPLGLQLPKWEFTWECEGSFPHTLCTPGSMKCDSRAQFWPTPLQTLALVVSPRLGLQHLNYDTWCNINLSHGILIENFQIKFKSIFRYVG